MEFEIEIKRGESTSIESITFPDSWDGLSTKQWRAAIGLKTILQEYGYIPGKICELLASLSNNHQMARLLFVEMNESVLIGIAEGIEWLSELPVHDESYYKGGILMRGPQRSMKDFRMKQFGLAQQFIQVYGQQDASETQRLKALRGLWSVTWRISFLPWTAWMCDVYLFFSKIVSNKTLALNLYNVWGMVQALKDRYPWVYDYTDDQEGPDHGFRSLLESLAGEKFGDYYQVQKAMLHDVMVHMDHNAHRVQKAKKDNKTT